MLSDLREMTGGPPDDATFPIVLVGFDVMEVLCDGLQKKSKYLPRRFYMKLACGAGVTRTPVINEQMSFMDIRRRHGDQSWLIVAAFTFPFWHWIFGSISFPLNIVV